MNDTGMQPELENPEEITFSFEREDGFILEIKKALPVNLKKNTV
jgi:hypothetical protein